MAKEPLWHFAKILFRDRLGVLAVVIAVAWGLLNGVLVPLWLSKLVGSLGKPEAWNIATQLSIIFLARGCAEVLRRTIADKVKRDLRVASANEIAIRLRTNPIVAAESSAQASVSQYLSAQVWAIDILSGDLPHLVVSLGGSLIVLVVLGVPAWTVLVFTLLIGAAAAAYWPLKNVDLHRKAASCENQEVEHLVAIRVAWGLEQFQPGLYRAQQRATRTAHRTRRRADRRMHGYIYARAAITAILGVAVAIAAVNATLEVTALLVVYAFAFSGHLTAIHFLAEFCQRINVDAAELLGILRQPTKSPLIPGQSEFCLQTHELSVVYEVEERVTNVSIGSLTVCEEQSALFTWPNGRGKSTLFRVIQGLVPYNGTMTLWGKERRDFDVSHTVALFPQGRIPLPIEVGDLFVDDEGHVDERLMRETLSLVNLPDDFDLTRIHEKLSGGLQQKVDLALLLYRASHVPGVRLVALDEPTNNLDKESVEMLRKVIVSFVDDYDGGILLTTHDELLQQLLRDRPRFIEAGEQ